MLDVSQQNMQIIKCILKYLLFIQYGPSRYIKIIFQQLNISQLIKMGINQTKQKFQKYSNRYKTKRFINEGPFSRVYLVQDTENRKLKAQKVIKQHLSFDQKAIVLEQIKKMMKINNISILKTYDYAIQQKIEKKDKTIRREYFHAIIEYINGQQLSEYLGKFNQQEILEIYHQIKSAILFLQKQNIKNRELNIDNIFIDIIDNNIHIKLTEFGILNQIKIWITQRNPKLKVSNYYKPPQSQNQKTSLTTDMWALGIILIELILGLQIKILNSSIIPGEDPTFPEEFFEKYQIKDDLKEILYPLLQKDPIKRKFYNEDHRRDYNHHYLKKIQQKKKRRVVKFRYLDVVQELTKDQTELDLTNCKIKKEGAVEISKKLRNLTYLNLARGDICKEGAIAIAKNLKNLTELNLALNDIQKQGAIEIANNLSQLTRLKLENNNIGKEGAIQIAKKLPNLIQLDLTNNKVGKEGAIQIARHLDRLTDLILNNNNIGKQGAIEISRYLKKLQLLELDDNNICKQGAIQIARNLTNLKHLSLSYNNIGNEAAIQIAKNLINLTELNLGYNSIGKQGAMQIATHLKQLFQLKLTHNQIDEASKAAIKQLRGGRPIDL